MSIDPQNHIERTVELVAQMRRDAGALVTPDWDTENTSRPSESIIAETAEHAIQIEHEIQEQQQSRHERR